MSNLRVTDLLNALHVPDASVGSREGPARGQDAYLVAASDGAAGELDSLGLMPLEDQAEGAPLQQGPDLALKVSRELWV
ncbi:hypothetical protein [Corynebacterium variabile]|uniref:hypothetical protein n=1 Tax=Corynebacterium variabile TaxID=1727 RepID=UPI002FE12782